MFFCGIFLFSCIVIIIKHIQKLLRLHNWNCGFCEIFFVASNDDVASLTQCRIILHGIFKVFERGFKSGFSGIYVNNSRLTYRNKTLFSFVLLLYVFPNFIVNFLVGVVCRLMPCHQLHCILSKPFAIIQNHFRFFFILPCLRIFHHEK